MMQQYPRVHYSAARQSGRSDCSGFASMVMGVAPGDLTPGDFSSHMFGAFPSPERISAAEDTGFCFPDIELDDDPDCWYYPGPEVAHSGHW